MPEDAITTLDRGGINARILAKEAKADFRRVESASRKIHTTLYSPEVKRLFVRFFNSMQLNIYFISVMARTKLPHEVVEKVEDALKGQIERINGEVNQALDTADLLCRENAITSLATYDAEPLTIEVKVISPFARRYLELMMKVDQLMPMLETLAIDELIEIKQLDLRKALCKKSLRQVAGAARNFAGGLRRRMNSMEADAGGPSKFEDAVITENHDPEPKRLPSEDPIAFERVSNTSKRTGAGRRNTAILADTPVTN